ncbi:hypothetical protein BOTCAL_0006g00270 [Botryotinia calthae]|uniref:Uncharacterized protein n=1 Tax=Botryotinia calthae TaxID=38488 RepID=A0A4Y8DHB6_9HELO|nr:hypothetical protein BOTCAL_0006g00270 [Botryotinia calthae]
METWHQILSSSSVTVHKESYEELINEFPTETVADVVLVEVELSNASGVIIIIDVEGGFGEETEAIVDAGKLCEPSDISVLGYHEDNNDGALEPVFGTKVKLDEFFHNRDNGTDENRPVLAEALE